MRKAQFRLLFNMGPMGEKWSNFPRYDYKTNDRKRPQITTRIWDDR